MPHWVIYCEHKNLRFSDWCWAFMGISKSRRLYAGFAFSHAFVHVWREWVKPYGNTAGRTYCETACRRAFNQWISLTRVTAADREFYTRSFDIAIPSRNNKTDPIHHTQFELLSDKVQHKLFFMKLRFSSTVLNIKVTCNLPQIKTERVKKNVKISAIDLHKLLNAQIYILRSKSGTYSIIL